MVNNLTNENFDIEFGEVQIVGGEGGSDGYDVGYEDGYAKGNADGYAKGNADGQEKGKAEGKEEGKQIGFADAISKQTELSVSYNGIYTPQNGSVGFNKVTVSVQEKKPNLQDKTFTANGTYSADENYDGLGSVVVAVPKAEIKLQEKTATENGEVVADSGFDGLSKVTVNVASGGGSGTNNLIKLIEGVENVHLTDDDLYGCAVIGEKAFFYQEKLKSIAIPNTVKEIKRYAFQYSGIESFEFPQGDVVFDTHILYNCKSLVSVVFGANMLSTPKSTCEGCSVLNNVIIQEGVQTITAGTFQSCTSLQRIDLPASIKSLETGAFDGCTKLDTVNIKATNPPTLGRDAFGRDAFYNCKALAQIIVPTGCGDTYKAATNWSAYADIIVEEGAV